MEEWFDNLELCPFCSTKLPDGPVYFCPECGNKLNKEFSKKEYQNNLNENTELKNYKYCLICGNKLNYTNYPQNKNVYKCESCLEKILILNIYFKIKNENNYINKESLKYYCKDNNYNNVWNLLIKYDMLKEFSGNIYKLSSNKNIEEIYAKFLKNNYYSKPKSKPIDNYWAKQIIEDENEKRNCYICGKELDDVLEENICSECFNKKETSEKLIKLLEFVTPQKGFTKSYLLEKGYFSIGYLEVMFTELINNDLLESIDSNDLFILKEYSILNNFIEKYSDDTIIPTPHLNKPKISISYENLKTEDSLDSSINLMDYIDYVYINYDKKIDKWILEFRKEDNISSKKVFSTTFEAKLNAIYYLEKNKLINVISTNNPNKTELDSKQIHICPICNNTFQINNKFSTSQKYCEECKTKYNYSELITITLIKEGKITQQTYKQIINLQKQGKTKTEIAKRLNLPNPTIIEPILHFFNQNMDTSSKTEDLVKIHKTMRIKNNLKFINIFLNGVISDTSRFLLFNKLRDFNCDMNIECKKIENYFEVNIKLKFDLKNFENQMEELKQLGWKQIN